MPRDPFFDGAIYWDDTTDEGEEASAALTWSQIRSFVERQRHG